MKNTIKTTFAILAFIFVGALVYYYQTNKPTPIENAPIVSEEDIRGCYVATSGKDVYTLTIISQDGDKFEGTLKFKNYEIDGSQGTFNGTYKDGVLSGIYNLQSEGMTSEVETIFKKEGSSFIRGTGPLGSGWNLFADLSKVVYDASSPRNVFKASSENCSVSTISQYINEENFSGTKSIIYGSRKVAEEARLYIEERVVDFRKTANAEVPDMRKEFGEDSPMANYMIYLDAEYLDGGKTESIVISEYVYTGGANGSSSFKVITADSQSGKILSLGDIVEENKQADFVKLIKSELKNWKVEDNDSFMLFGDAIDMLTFDSFQNWSLDPKNLTIYFDKYEIGPGVVGAVAFPVPLEKVTLFLSESYQ